MKTSRLKEIVIVLLSLLNVFLLTLLVSRRLEERAARDRRVTQLVTLFDSAGVRLNAELVPEEEIRFSPVEPARDLDSEALFAGTLLGTCDQEDVGGGIYRYVGESGQCLLRSGGAVEASLSRDVGEPEAYCESLFARFGYVPLSAEVREGDGTVTGVKMPAGIRIFNAQLTLSFSDGALTEVSGSFVPAFEPGRRGGGLDGVTALVKFLDYMRGSGEVCTAVNAVGGGYLLQSTASVPQRLYPVWCVETDVFRYYVNIVTGEVSRET